MDDKKQYSHKNRLRVKIKALLWRLKGYNTKIHHTKVPKKMWMGKDHIFADYYTVIVEE